jgi:hypothetical protein
MTMSKRLQARLGELKRQYQIGEGELRELGRQEAALRETLLRIAGAIQVLEELLRTSADEATPPAGQAEPDGDSTVGQNGNRGPHEVLTVPECDTSTQPSMTQSRESDQQPAVNVR